MYLYESGTVVGAAKTLMSEALWSLSSWAFQTRKAANINLNNHTCDCVITSAAKCYEKSIGCFEVM